MNTDASKLHVTISYKRMTINGFALHQIHKCFLIKEKLIMGTCREFLTNGNYKSSINCALTDGILEITYY